MRYPWADPTEGVFSDDVLEFEPQIDSLPAGWITLETDLPSMIARPFCDTYAAIGSRTVMNADTIAEDERSLETLSYFKSARQLYSTMTPSNKTANQPLKPVYYDDTKIPKHMGAAISMIGNFDSKLGEIRVKNESTLFKRWIAKGIAVFEQIQEEDPFSYIWPDADGYDIVREQTVEYFTQHRGSFNVEVNGEEVPVTSPELTHDNIDTYTVHDQYPNAQRLRALLAIARIAPDAWKRNDHAVRDHDAVLTDILGIKFAPPDFTVRRLRERFEDISRDLEVFSKTRLSGHMFVETPPAGTRGFPAQIAKREGNRVEAPLPLSDPDYGLGYMFSPRAKFELNPRIIAYGKRTSDRILADFSDRDVASKAF
jgi:hypothetical protein